MYTLNIKIEKNGSTENFTTEVDEDELQLFKDLKSDEERIKYAIDKTKEQQK